MKRISINSLLVTFSVVILIACTAAPTATPVPERRVQATPVPTDTAEPTATPLPPQPPTLFKRSPAEGEEQRIDAPIILYFDQDMNTDSVEAAWSMEPTVEGSFSWQDESVLRFTPGTKLQRNAQYRVTIDTSAASAEGLELERPITFRFRTVGFVHVTNVFPMPDSTDVDIQTTVRVIFNRPIVPLTGVEEQEDLPDPLTFSPPLEGTGQWTNTSIYSFEPSTHLAPGTEYTVRVSAGLKDTTGGILPEEYTWSFKTELPKVVSVSPSPNAQYVSRAPTITISFNQPMDKKATQERFSLLQEGKEGEISGTFTWDENAMIYAPDEPLQQGATYTASLAKGAPAASGEVVIPEAYKWSFSVISPPKIVSTHPRDGQLFASGEALEITFSSPISRETFLKGITINPTTTLHTYWQEEDTLVRLYGYLEPSTIYTVTCSTDIQGRDGDPLAKRYSFSFETEALPPMVGLDTPGQIGTYNAYSTPETRIRHRNVSQVTMELYSLPREDFIALNSEEGWRFWRKYQPQKANLTRRWSQKVSGELNAMNTISVKLASGDGAKLSPGLYLLQVSAPEATDPQRHILVVSHMNLTLKSTEDEALVWVTDMRDGSPVPGADIAIYSGQGKRIAESTTDADGIATAQFEAQEPWAPLVVFAESAKSMGVVINQWSSGISPWDFGLTSAPVKPEYKAYIYTDRDIYRPGQTVHFKGVLRDEEDARYDLPPQESSIEMTVFDGQGREIWHEILKTSKMGTVYGEISLSEGAALGYYRIQAVYKKESTSTQFQVAEYRRPEFQVGVEADQADYIQGDTIEATAQADYFFGGPVNDATVTWRVMRRPYTFDRWEGKGHYSFQEWDYEDRRFALGPYGELITEGQGTTDAQGEFTFTVPADIEDKIQSQVYTLEVSVVDLNNQEVSARTTAIVHKGTFYIGLGAERYIGTAGKEQTVRVLTVDTQGEPVGGKDLTVVFYKHEWYSVKEEAEDGRFYWTNKTRDTAVVTRTVTTDEEGRALVHFTPPEGGTYKVLASGLDEYENEVRSTLYLWISGREFINWGQENTDRVELVADKDSYKPGETARILIPSPYQGKVKGLLTIERGSILEHRLIELEGNSEQIAVPIRPEHAPNIYVSVVLVKGMEGDETPASFKMGLVMLPVSTERKELQISIRTDRTGTYKPREQVNYDIQVSDYQGQGVKAELSLQLVDLAIESLVQGSQPDIVEAFYRERGLGVRTAASLVQSVDRYNLERPEEGKGGGGGGPGGTVREDFPDTAFWAPAVETDSKGKATVAVDLPDTLTTWRLTAQAVTAETEVGKAHADIVSTLDVMIRPAVPRFFVIDDQPILGAAIHNNTARDLQMTASLEADGLEIEEPEQTIAVPARGRKSVSWPARVEAVESAELQFSVSGGTYADAVRLSLPVYHMSTPEVVGTSGQVEDRVLELVRVPQEADEEQGELRIQLDPSLTAGMREGLDYLRTYPYLCIEQTVSRFLPNVVTYRTLRDLGIEAPELQAQLPQQVGVALQRIYTTQNLDGGWGWWKNDDSSPILTGYVLLGLTEARRGGFAVDDEVSSRAIQYLQEWLNGETEDTRAYWDQRATVLYALAEADEGDLGRSVALFEERDKLSLYSRAYLAMTLQLLNPEEDSRLNTLVNELVDAAIVSATGAHWEEVERVGLSMNTDTRTHAIVLRALVRIQPENEILPMAVRWLMTARESGRWETTQENVWAILALTDYMLATGELKGDYDYTLMVNDEKEADGTVTPQKLEQPIRSQISMENLRRDAANVVSIERYATGDQTGEGKLYYSAFLRYFLPADQIEALNRGIIVNRQYLLEDSEETTTKAQVNDVLIVKLTLIAPNDLYYLVLEDPLPAGCEAIDASLETSRSAEEVSRLERVEEGEKSAQQALPYWYHPWPTHTELRDEKAILFADHLPRGTYEYTYRVRCSTPGDFHVMPVSAYEMYEPDVFGRSAGTSFTVKMAD
ncbi:MAG: Ig-like domain-containing protein [Chloroflexota bacterium]|nr:Ig-like domain-containing protein [Chloroflexota bacterium]